MIALFCAGTHGRVFADILQMLQIQPDFFLDNDKKKWNTQIDGMMCYEPARFSGRKDVLVFACIEMRYYFGIVNDIKQRGFEWVADFTDVFDDLIAHYPDEYFRLIEKSSVYEEAGVFYCLSSNKKAAVADFTKPVRDRIAVYTGIFGGYDEICLPRVQPPNIDYYFISDEPPVYGNPFQWIDARSVIPNNITDPIKKNRYIKMHAHKLFPQYRYSVYIDGNITLIADASMFVQKNKSGVSAFMLPWRDCVYYEAFAVVNDRRVLAEDVSRQMRRYLEEGMPMHYGLPEMSVIAMEHGKSECIGVMETWWREFVTGAQRDQLSFMYAMWKNGMGLADMMSLGDDVRNSPYLYKTKHPCRSREIVNPDG